MPLQGHAHAAWALRAAMRDKALLFSKEQCAKLEGFVAKSKVSVMYHVPYLPACRPGCVAMRQGIDRQLLATAPIQS